MDQTTSPVIVTPVMSNSSDRGHGVVTPAVSPSHALPSTETARAILGDTDCAPQSTAHEGPCYYPNLVDPNLLLSFDTQAMFQSNLSHCGLVPRHYADVVWINKFEGSLDAADRFLGNTLPVTFRDVDYLFMSLKPLNSLHGLQVVQEARGRTTWVALQGIDAVVTNWLDQLREIVNG